MLHIHASYYQPRLFPCTDLQVYMFWNKQVPKWSLWFSEISDPVLVKPECSTNCVVLCVFWAHLGPLGHLAWIAISSILLLVDLLESDPRSLLKHQGIIHHITENPDLNEHSHIYIYIYIYMYVWWCVMWCMFWAHVHGICSNKARGHHLFADLGLTKTGHCLGPALSRPRGLRD